MKPDATHPVRSVGDRPFEAADMSQTIDQKAKTVRRQMARISAELIFDFQIGACRKEAQKARKC